MDVISLGWGVQSFGLAAMVALKELPPVAAAVHADTIHERQATYEFAERWTPWLEARGVMVVTVSDRKAANALFGKSGQMSLPAFTVNPKTGKAGQLRRSCTQRWKIAPQRRWLSTELARRGLAKGPGIIDQWFGITRDEWIRMRDSDVAYVRNVYPFMDFEPPMTRYDVGAWLDSRGLEIPPKSACVFCPYHSRAAWREMQLEDGPDWHKALEVDYLIRDKRPGFKCYLSDQRLPLNECDFKSEQEYGQLELWSNDECSGNCFI